MATTTQYLEQLQADKQTLVDNLVAKGIDASNDETFTSLAPKVADIQSGGGGEEYWNLEAKTSGYLVSYLKNIPLIDTSGYEDLNGFLNWCSSLEEVPNLDTSNCTNMNGMFKACSLLTTIPFLNTTKVTNMSNMFYDCSSIKTIPLLDTSNVTSMSSMFMGCKAIETIPDLNTSNVTSMSSMFRDCESLKEIPQMDTSKVTNMSGMFQGCKKLETIPLLDASSVVNVGGNAFYQNNELTNLGGFKDLGKAYLTTQSTKYGSYKIQLNTSAKLTHDSLMNVINNLYDIATAGVKPQELILGSTNLAKLTEEEKAIATNKGWTLS